MKPERQPEGGIFAFPAAARSKSGNPTPGLPQFQPFLKRPFMAAARLQVPAPPGESRDPSMYS